MQQLVTNRRRSRRITLSLPAAAHQPTRRSGRIVCRIAILLFGHDEEGITFTERTHTVMLSLHGAGVLSTHRFAPEQELILRVEETSREAVVRVVGEIATEGELHTYAVAFLDDGLDFWQTEFPPAQVSDARPMALPLECVSCSQRAEVTSGQFEYDISQIHGGLMRHCAECGVLTVWRRADGKGPSFAGEDKALKAQGKPESDILGKKRRFARSEIRSPVPGGSSGVDDRFFPHRNEAMGASNLRWRDNLRPHAPRVCQRQLRFVSFLKDRSPRRHRIHRIRRRYGLQRARPKANSASGQNREPAPRQTGWRSAQSAPDADRMPGSPPGATIHSRTRPERSRGR